MAGSKRDVVVVNYDGSRFAIIADSTTVQIDPKDSHLLGLANWRFSARRGVYGRRSLGSAEAGRELLILHRLIVGATNSFEKVVHVNGDKTDCRRENLVADTWKSPFTAGRLEELYWSRGWTLRKIAQEASEILERPPVADATVRRWLELAGIRIKTRSELSKMILRRPSVRAALRAGHRRFWNRVHRGELPNPMVEWKMPARVTRLGRNAAARKRREEATVVTCARRGCGKTFRRPPSMMGRVGGDLTRVFCSHSCAISVNNRARKWRQKPQTEQVPDWLQEAMESANH